MEINLDRDLILIRMVFTWTFDTEAKDRAREWPVNDSSQWIKKQNTSQVTSRWNASGIARKD